MIFYGEWKQAADKKPDNNVSIFSLPHFINIKATKKVEFAWKSDDFCILPSRVYPTIVLRWKYFAL